ncbi:glycosyltransferase family 2 protein [Phytomonospora endophytica]|uniref:Glycosyltransferase involved in cell wall biosynthesis n=1 Tax=Phytomonospora endophytica TaxID=714109 RepID=A0A841F828_9ACTN|nr:glycosyltransferase [Phytomonospora endophytica]MBB6033211.1 glycosyltransferase involved in cell wall biosynthesis [Phytomonospora endophytica]GIG65438.1 glycosyl transferase [Phytomonospora endophytica]
MNHTPAVTIVVPVYNAMPWLTEAINSILAQTIGRDQLEIIAVDDGSTDGSGAELDRFAAAESCIKVIHQENSGGPGKPCNVGLDNATGEYVYFVGADDYLGPKAMAKMLDMARRAKSDIVLGKMVPAPGFGNRAPRGMWGRNEAKVDLLTSQIYLALSQVKLFRRAFVEGHGLRFPTGQLVSSDQPFTAEAYFRAEVISVVADYDCYYVRNRPDDSNVTRRTHDPLPWLDQAERLLNTIAEYVPAGPGRDNLVTRHFRFEILPCLGSKHPRFADRWLNGSSPEEQRKVLDRVKELCDTWLTDNVLDKLAPDLRVRAYCVRENKTAELTDIITAQLSMPEKAITDGGRVYLRLPHFRDESARIPDRMFELDNIRVVHRLDFVDWTAAGLLTVGGHAHLTQVDTDGQTVELLVRKRGSDVEYRIAAAQSETPELADASTPYDYTRAGFRAGVDFATLAAGAPAGKGVWDLSLSVSSKGVTVERRLGSERAKDIATGHRLRVLPDGEGGHRFADGYFGVAGNLSVDVGGKLKAVAENVRCTRLDSSRTSLDVTARMPLSDVPDELDVSLVVTRSGKTVALPTELSFDEDGVTATAHLSAPMLKLRPGTWAVKARIAHEGGGRSFPAIRKGGKPAEVGVLPRIGALLRKVFGS